MIKHIQENFKGKSLNTEGNNCLYRGLNGTKCAVGLFIPDEVYVSSLEEKNIIQYREIHKFLPLSPFQMYDLQICHDTSHPDRTLSDMINWIKTYVVK